MPIGAVGGREEIMRSLSPLGPVYQAGTLSGNPVAVAAGLTTMKLIREEDPYPAMAALAKRLTEEVNASAREGNVEMHCACLGGMFTPFFSNEDVTDLAAAKLSNTKAHAAFFHSMLEQGCYLPPSQFEVAFISAAHTEADVDAFVTAARSAFSST